jgi:Zn-dependent peptidase ImmA (M78 family)
MSTEAIERFAARVMEAAGLQPVAPVPLERLAAAYGVDSIVRSVMIEDGRLEQRNGRTVIFLREGSMATRQRFTLAHELGHLMLAKPDEDFTARRMWSGPDREERFCDQFAAAVLLPRDWVIAQFGGAPERLSVVRKLARTAEASLSASLLRLREVLGWERSLLHWRRYEGDWRLISTAGLPRHAHNRLTSEAATRALLDALTYGPDTQEISLPIALAGRSTVIPAEASVGERSAVALAAFARERRV